MSDVICELGGLVREDVLPLVWVAFHVFKRVRINNWIVDVMFHLYRFMVISLWNGFVQNLKIALMVLFFEIVNVFLIHAVITDIDRF